MNKINQNLFSIVVLIFTIQLAFPQYSYAYNLEHTVGSQASMLVMANLDQAVLYDNNRSYVGGDLPKSGWAEPRKVRKVVITAYSSTVDQCDDTPFITANGTRVKDGIVATNLLPFGAKVTFPELYGDKVFTVTDRMHERFSDRFDIWMETREEAIQFGAKYATVEMYF